MLKKHDKNSDDHFDLLELKRCLQECGWVSTAAELQKIIPHTNVNRIPPEVFAGSIIHGATAQAKRRVCLANTAKDLKFYGGVLVGVVSITLIIHVHAFLALSDDEPPMPAYWVEVMKVRTIVASFACLLNIAQLVQTEMLSVREYNEARKLFQGRMISYFQPMKGEVPGGAGEDEAG